MEPSHDRPSILKAVPSPKSGSEPLSSSSSEPFWSQVCTLLRVRIGREFDRWFRNLSAHATDDGIVCITVPNPINQLWIESNYATVLSETITEVLGGARAIQYTVDVASGERLPADTAEPELALSFRQMGTPAAARELHGIAEPLSTPEVVVARTPESLADAGLSPKFSFENFVVGTTNSYCAAVAKAVAEKPGRIYNPLFFHSAPGLGKTHLLHAIGREIMFRKKRAVVRYVTSESFTNEFIDAIRKQTLSQFRAKYRKVDVLLIDDVQFFAGKDSTQEEFFHTFNELFNNTKQIVLASDRAPGDIKDLEARLVSRFEWGLTTQIQMPDYETRMAILERKLQDLGGQMDRWILEFIAQRVRTDVRKLEGSLMRVAAHFSIAEGVQPSEVVIEGLLRDVLDQEPGRSVNIDRIQRMVAERYDIRLSELNGRGRPKMIAEARQVAMYLTREMAKLSLVEVGKAFGGRDHGTVIHACKVVNARMDQGEDFRVMIADLKAKISAP